MSEDLQNAGMIEKEIDDALLKMDMKDDAAKTEEELDALLMMDTKVIEDLLALDDNKPLHSWDDTLSKMDIEDNARMIKEDGGSSPTVDALVERWRPKMHTFHLPHGECMITLEDVVMILGLRTDGLPVTGSTNHSTSGLENKCLTQFGVAPRPNDHKGSEIKLACWGSACLSHMYRSLCRALRYDYKDMDGPLALLLVWAWIQMPTIRPLSVDTSFPLARRFDMFFQFVWDAYSSNLVASHVIPFDINNGANLWSTTVPLICFEAVKWYPTDRIRRQFGFYQDSPVKAMKLGPSHNIVLTGEHVNNYQPSDQYMDWYIGKFGDHLRLSELAEQEEEGQQEQPHQRKQQPQQEQPPQQQGPPQQKQPLVSQLYEYAPYPYLPYQQPYPYRRQYLHPQYFQEYAQSSTQPFIQPPYSQPYPHYPPRPYTQEHTQPFTHPSLQLYGQLSTMCEAYRLTQALQGISTHLLGTVAQDEDQYRHIIDWVQGPESSQWVNDLYSIQDPLQVSVADVLDVRHPPQAYSEHSRARISIDLVRSVHIGIGCRQSLTQISMPEGDEEENEDTVDETSEGEDVVDETLANEDEVDQPGTGDDVVGDESGSDVQGKGYNLRVDPARKSRSKWSSSLIKKRVKKGCSKGPKM
ncbi:hypothetical protein Ahy_A07g034520 [Arachis hypogaea]|uniref:Aminotransferase-like plant mobile domain-containing protein n=1 Tax=Arachis hypogaea TaxID=3818 RepID=A0A445CC65_ARAHY|nr:hypothetical protein Ahy_A07g034520 [Arachis hypogaea]